MEAPDPDYPPAEHPSSHTLSLGTAPLALAAPELVGFVEEARAVLPPSKAKITRSRSLMGASAPSAEPDESKATGCLAFSRNSRVGSKLAGNAHLFFFLGKKLTLSVRMADVWVCRRIPFAVKWRGKKTCRISILMN